jgi:hypothetical protein
MLNRIRGWSRRKVFAVLAALAVAATAAGPVLVRDEVTAVPAPHYRNYYSSSSYTTQVGRGMWTCQGTYQQLWGTTSFYYKTTPIDCSGVPIDPLE